MAKNFFDQEQKLTILDKAQEIEIKEAAKIAGVHYTTVYDWRNKLQAWGREALSLTGQWHLGRVKGYSHQELDQISREVFSKAVAKLSSRDASELIVKLQQPA